MVNSQRASPTDRQRRRLFVPTHPEIASVSDSSSLEVWKMDPIEARAVWSHEVVFGGAGAESVFDGCMVELSKGVGMVRCGVCGLWFAESRSYGKWYIVLGDNSRR